jgi:RNA polymerase sporulation-specific sigma factor
MPETIAEYKSAELIFRYKNGEKDLEEQILSENMGLVRASAYRLIKTSSFNIDIEDLFQVGSIGLLKAIRRFDINRGVVFSTYAVPMIIGEIRRYLRDNNSIRISRSMRDLAYRSLQAREELMRERSTEPTIEEVAARVGEKKEAVVRAMEAIVEPISLYEPVFNDAGGAESVYVIDQISDANSSEEIWLENIVLREAMQELSEREQKIIRLRYYMNKTQMEIAEEIGISQAQVSRLEKGALLRMRAKI